MTTETPTGKPSDYDLFGDDSSDDEDLVKTASSAKKKISGSDLDDSSDEEAAAVSSSKKKGRLLKKGKVIQKKKAKDDSSPKKSKKKKKTSVIDDDNDEDDAGLSKKDKLEKLQRSKRQKRMADDDVEDSVSASANVDESVPRKKKRDESEKKDSGYESGDSYNSGAGQERTKDDDDFLDLEGEDEDIVKEYFQEQHFHDERGEGSKMKHPDDMDEDDDEESDKVPDNPIMAAVHRMKKIKRVEKSRDERDDIAKDVVNRMRIAAEEDTDAIAARKPALKKLSMLGEVQEMLAKKDMQRPLLDSNLLVVAKSWIMPLPNGKLGNVTVRQRVLECIGAMTGGNDGEEGVSANDLKDSGFGKVVMGLYRHKSETPQMKRLHKSLIEQWSRPIFNKSNNMKDRERVDNDRRHAGVFLTHQLSRGATANLGHSIDEGSSSGAVEDINSILKKGYKTSGSREIGNNRVRIPFSKGFQFTVRPEGRTDNTIKLKKAGRESLTKRLTEKKRIGKAARQGGLSVEGRPAKG